MLLKCSIRNEPMSALDAIVFSECWKILGWLGRFILAQMFGGAEIFFDLVDGSAGFVSNLLILTSVRDRLPQHPPRLRQCSLILYAHLGLRAYVHKAGVDYVKTQGKLRDFDRLCWFGGNEDGEENNRKYFMGPAQAGHFWGSPASAVLFGTNNGL